MHLPCADGGQYYDAQKKDSIDSLHFGTDASLFEASLVSSNVLKPVPQPPSGTEIGLKEGSGTRNWMLCF